MRIMIQTKGTRNGVTLVYLWRVGDDGLPSGDPELITLEEVEEHLAFLVQYGGTMEVVMH